MCVFRVLFSLSCLAPAAFAAAPTGLRAGAYAADITPTTLPTPVNGNMKGSFTKTVTDPMHARALAIQDGRAALILCVVDSCMIPREICEAAKAIAAKQTGIAASNMLISATHSHSCATMTPVFQSDPDPAYVAELPVRIAHAMIRAHANLEPAELAWGKDSDPTQVFNRRWFMQAGQTYENPFDSMGDRVRMNPGYKSPEVSEPAGPVDPEVCILAARAKADRRPIAVLANYSLHYVGGLPAISADYFGAFARELNRRLATPEDRYAGKPAFVGIMSNGTSGNINNANYAGARPEPRKPGEQIELVAKSVSDAAMRAWEKLSWQSSAPIASRERDLSLAVRKATPAELERARSVLAATPRDKDGQFSDRKAIYAREATLLDAYPDKVPVKLQAHRIGGLTIAAIPCEVFVEIGIDLKKNKALDEHFTISLANGYNGYLPTPEHHRLGGYETWRARSSYLETNASTVMVKQLKELLAELTRP
jgi:neutral ceramidase